MALVAYVSSMPPARKHTDLFHSHNSSVCKVLPHRLCNEDPHFLLCKTDPVLNYSSVSYQLFDFEQMNCSKPQFPHPANRDNKTFLTNRQNSN